MKNILAIDLGTSSLKILYNDGSQVHKIKEDYRRRSNPDSWWRAILRGLKRLDLSSVRAIGLSSQVGTYIVGDEDYFSWLDPVGKEELLEMLPKISREEFIAEISMPHPKILSYPLPRLAYIKKHFLGEKKVFQPKDMICEKLTGRYVSDKFSWRGLANLKTCKYSENLLQKLGLDGFSLPELHEPTDIIGYVTEEASLQTGLPCGIPVCVGCNDFFAGLLGTGIRNEGDAFDITGTSEHIGILCNAIPEKDNSLICGPYFWHNVHYGVTQSAGASIRFGMGLQDFTEINAEECLKNSPPIFLPYLVGERAPIWDHKARGVYFGIGEFCSKNELAYAAAEGVCFSIYHIYETMGKPPIGSLTVSGGASCDPLMNKIKASLFGCPVYVTEENDASAYGAMILAAMSMGDISAECDMLRELCPKKLVAEPDEKFMKILRERFETYKDLYPALKEQFQKQGEINI